MATGRITKTAVDRATPGAVDRFLWDDEIKGFGLKVTPSGAKSYIIQYRTGGRGSPTRRYTMGRHGALTPHTAKTEAKRLLGLVSEGKDPASDKRDARTVSVDLSFPKFAERFLDQYVKPEWPASYNFAEGVLRLHVTPRLKPLALPAIRRADVARVFDAMPSGKPALRRNVHAVMRRLFRWAVSRGDIDRSPMDGVDAPPGAPSRDRVLSDEELRIAWEASASLGYPFRTLYRLLIATGQRREEVAGLDWSELNRKASLWTLPALRSKNGSANHIHLSALALAELDDVAAGDKWPRSGFVMTTNGKTSISGFSRGKMRLDRAIAEATEADIGRRAFTPWRVHDFRRTFATGMQRLGVRFEVTEAVLNHVSGSKSGVAGVYQRHDWKDEKRAALDAWCRHLVHIMNLSNDANIVSLDDRRGEQRG